MKAVSKANITFFVVYVFFNHRKLNSQWEGKVRIIGTLELNLQQLQESFKEKESQLILEKDQAITYAK